MCVQKGWGRVQVRRLYPSPPQSDRSQTHQSETRSFDYCRRGAFAVLWYGRYCQMIALQEDLAAPEAHEQELCSSQGIEAALHVASGGRHCTLLQGGGSGEGKFFAPSFPHVFAMVSILALLLPNQPSRPSPPLACVSHA